MENTVPEVGRVRVVVPVVAKVNEFAPVVIKLAPAVILRVLVPLLVMVNPLNVVPVAAPAELTWNWELEPTANREDGLAVPMPTFPCMNPRLLGMLAWLP